MKIRMSLNKLNMVVFEVNIVLLHGYPNCGTPDDYVLDAHASTLEGATAALRSKIENKVKELSERFADSWFSIKDIEN